MTPAKVSTSTARPRAGSTRRRSLVVSPSQKQMVPFHCPHFPHLYSQHGPYFLGISNMNMFRTGRPPPPSTRCQQKS